MWKLYSYDQLKGKIKVGDRVRAAKGKFNPCEELGDNRLNEQEITRVRNNCFYINGCEHNFYQDASFLELFVPEPSWDNLEVGMMVTDLGGNRREVLGVSSDGDWFLFRNYPNIDLSCWILKEIAQQCGWIIEGATSEPKPEVKFTKEQVQAINVRLDSFINSLPVFQHGNTQELIKKVFIGILKDWLDEHTD